MGDLEVTLEIGSRTFYWQVIVSPIHDTLLLGLDAMQFANVIVYAGCQAFVVLGSTDEDIHFRDFNRTAFE